MASSKTGLKQSDASVREGPMSLDEAALKHLDRWVLLEVTEAAPETGPTAGIVVYVSGSEMKVVSRLLVLMSQRPSQPYHVLYGCRRGHTGQEWRAAIEQVLRDESFDVGRWR